MKIFACQACNRPLFFENVQCGACGAHLGFIPDCLELSALELAASGLWRALAAQPGCDSYRMCANYHNAGVCNWLVPADQPHDFCMACRLSAIVPDLSVAGNHERWALLEAGKRRLVYGLLQLGLPVVDRLTDPDAGLEFRFMEDVPPSFRESGKVMTGHADGVITINLVEADSAVREQLRLDMNENYRTIIGHFRHEIGHYYWERLINHGARLEPFRALFGDERMDYDEALSYHYTQGPPENWAGYFVTPYASMHPWEDWAETWAHYLHMCDTLETAGSFELSLRAPMQHSGGEHIAIGRDVFRADSFDDLLQQWYPLTFATNSINRSMGQPDLYPFVLSDNALGKLRFVHDTVRAARQS